MRIAEHIQAIQPPPITEVKSWLSEANSSADKPLIDLCQAVPSYPPPPELIEHLQHQLGEEQSFKYTPDEGLLEVRQSVCDWYQRHYLSAPIPEQLCLTIGASQAFWLAITCLCRPGDEVIVQLPAYFDHPMGLQALGIKPIYAPFNPENAGLPETDKLATLISSKTRAILLVSPSNPTGAVIPPEQIEELFQLAQKHRIALILDETYNAFIGQPPHTLFSRSDWPYNFIQLASFGKTYALTGLRCGALIAGDKLIHQALKVQDSMAVCQPRPAQLALKFGCQQLDPWIAANRQLMRRRHDRFKDEFLDKENPFQLIASGSFFAWIKHPWSNLTGRQAARKLVEEANLICLPGEAFGPGLEQYLRLAFGNLSDSQIPTAAERFQTINN